MSNRLVPKSSTMMILKFVLIGLVSSSGFSDSFNKYLNNIRKGTTESEEKSVANLLSLISSLEDSSQTKPQMDFMQEYLSDKSDTEDANSWFQNYQNSHG